MTKEITDKTHCIIYRDIRMYVNKEKAIKVMDSVQNKNIQHIRIDEQLFPTMGLSVVKAELLETSDRQKRGEWKCKQGYWHKRFDKCAHEYNGAYEAQKTREMLAQQTK